MFQRRHCLHCAIVPISDRRLRGQKKTTLHFISCLVGNIVLSWRCNIVVAAGRQQINNRFFEARHAFSCGLRSYLSSSNGLRMCELLLYLLALELHTPRPLTLTLRPSSCDSNRPLSRDIRDRSVNHSGVGHHFREVYRNSRKFILIPFQFSDRNTNNFIIVETPIRQRNDRVDIADASSA